MRIVKHSWIGAFAMAAVLLAPAPAAIAQDGPGPTPQQIASRCVDGIRATTHHGINAIFDSSRRTIRAIYGLADEGAPAFIIWRVASDGRDRVNAITRAHAEQINGIAAHCVRTLRDMNADEDLIEAVLRARARGLHHLLRAHDGAVRRIFGAANEATGASLSSDRDGDVIDGGSLDEGSLYAD